jgi:uncharacterized protein YajQ (UPF0234 family)
MEKLNESKMIDTALEESLMLDSAKYASSKAIRSSMALGLTIKYIKNKEIILLYPDKTMKVLRKIEGSNIDVSFLKKGMVLVRK